MAALSSIVTSVKNLPLRVFGSRNERILKRMSHTVEISNALESEMASLCAEGSDFDAAFATHKAQLTEPEPDDSEAVAEYERQLQELRVELSMPLRERSDELKRRLR